MVVVDVDVVDFDVIVGVVVCCSVVVSEGEIINVGVVVISFV